MATKILELWISTNTGLSFLHIQGKYSTADTKITGFLFSGFLSAVESMAAEAIDAIKMKDSKIIIVPVKDIPSCKFFVVGRASAKEKDDNIRKVLFKIRDNFLGEFRQILPTWAGEQNMFDFFADKVKNEFVD